jgi:ribosome-associated protein YbcJ (S4-like RNA binding protein)
VKVKTVKLKPDQEYIKLQSLLQIADIISNGGEAKIFLVENEVMVNGEPENRRG